MSGGRARVVEEARLAPFCWQSLDACAAIRLAFKGKERTYAIAIYDSLTWAANEQRTRERVELPRLELADLAGVSDRTLDRYTRLLERLGLVVKTGTKGQVTTWRLVEPDTQKGEKRLLTPSEAASHQMRSGFALNANGLRTPTITRARESRQEVKKEETPYIPLGELSEDYVGWLSHHWATTGMAQPPEGSAGWEHVGAMYARCRDDGYQAVELECAIEAAYADEFRRARGFFDHESVLNPIKVHKLVEAGKRARAGGGARRGPDWRAWVADQLPDLDGFAADLAFIHAQMLGSGKGDVDPQAVRQYVERRLADDEQGAA